jgi:hypothetical protein
MVVLISQEFYLSTVSLARFQSSHGSDQTAQWIAFKFADNSCTSTTREMPG